MNGRELDASDIEYNFHRVTALGSGFTEPSPTGWIKDLPIESIAATDKWTVVVKLKEPNLQALMNPHPRPNRHHITPRGNQTAGRRQRLEEPGRHWALYAD